MHVAVVDADGRLVARHGDPNRLTTMRSAAKPFQAEPLVASGALDAFAMDDEVLAVCCASHHGMDMHAAAVRRGLAAAGLGPEVLRNATGPPEQHLRHNCSGNHLAFLAHAAHRGWDIPGYRELDHPAQRAALEVVAGAAGVAGPEVETCTDGCGVVCFVLPLATIAGMYARLDALVPRQHAAMRAHPAMVAGPGDLDTELMRALDGCVAKGGAEGLGCVSLSEPGLGIAIRIEDGASRAVDPAVMAVLAQILRWEHPPAGLTQFASPELRNSPGDVVGFLRADIDLVED